MDVVWSRLVGEDEEGTLAALQALQETVIEPTVAAHRGRIVKTTGDGVLVEFASVVDAVRCASAVQSRMKAENAALPEDERLVFRIGINLGDVVAADDDSRAVNVSSAVRLCFGRGAEELACIAVRADARCSVTVAGVFRPTPIKMRSRLGSSGRSQPRSLVPWAQACHWRTIWSATLPSSLSEVVERVIDDLAWTNIQPSVSVSIRMSSTGASVSNRSDRILASPNPNRSFNRRSAKSRTANPASNFRLESDPASRGVSACCCKQIVRIWVGRCAHESSRSNEWFNRLQRLGCLGSIGQRYA